MRVAVVTVPAVFVVDLIARLTSGMGVPRWYIYAVIWAIALWQASRPVSNALWLLIPVILFLSLDEVVGALVGSEVALGGADSGTALALLTGLGLLAATVAKRSVFYPVVGLAAVAIVAASVSSGHIERLAADDRALRVAAPAALVVLAAWLIRRLDDELAASLEQAQEISKSKDSFIATVSHELRTPLTGVVGLADELHANHGVYDDVEIEELLGVISDQGHEMAEIIEDLITASQGDKPQVSLKIEEVDLRAEVERVVAADRLASRMKGRRPRIAGPSAIASADGLRCRQIIRNLVTNAYRYGGEHVSVDIGYTHQTATLTVSDDGQLDATHLDRLFEPYYAARESSVAGSVGLGLPVSRELARMMGGDVTVGLDGDRTVFRLELPLAKASTGSRL